MVTETRNSAEVKHIARVIARQAVEAYPDWFQKDRIINLAGPDVKSGNISASISQIVKGGLLERVKEGKRFRYRLNIEALCYKMLHTINRQAGARRRRSERLKSAS